MRPEGTLSYSTFTSSREEQCDRGFDLSTPGPPSKILVAIVVVVVFVVFVVVVFVVGNRDRLRRNQNKKAKKTTKKQPTL